ncbi:MAG TPA: hypothetical protein VIJ13_01365, partial [Actinomycetota bacterium]
AVRPVAEGPGTATERLREMIAAHVRVVTGGRERAKVFLFEWAFLGEDRRAAVRQSAWLLPSARSGLEQPSVPVSLPPRGHPAMVT